MHTCARAPTLLLRPPSALPMSLARTQSPSGLIAHDAETAAAVSLAGPECVCDTGHVIGRLIWSMVGAARPLGLVPFGCNVTACRSGAL